MAKTLALAGLVAAIFWIAAETPFSMGLFLTLGLVLLLGLLDPLTAK